MFHHQPPYFSTGSRSFRRPPSHSQLPRPSIFFASTNMPSYIGSSTPSTYHQISPFGTLPRRMSIGGQIGLFCRPPIHSMEQHQNSAGQQSYCTVEEIKEGKRQRAAKGQQQKKMEEENYYEEQDEEEDEGRNGQKEGGGGHYDDDYYGVYERAPNSRPNSASEMKKVQAPLPPPLPPPIPKSQNGWSTEKIIKKQQKTVENSPKEMFKRRTSRTKLALFLLPLLALCSLLLVLPFLLLWLLSVPSMEWPNILEHRPRSKPIEWNGIGQQIPKGIPELVMEPEKLAKLVEGGENGKRLRIFEVREGHRREKESPPAMNSIIPFINVRSLQIGSLSHNGVPVHPLQFQRLLRAQSVDSDSFVILLDRHPLGLLAAYALWIFRLYGHDGAFMLNGGLVAWQKFTANNPLRNLSLNLEEIGERRSTTGTFRAEWRPQSIATFDDLLANFDSDQGPSADIADAQSQEEFDGKIASGELNLNLLPSSAVIFGHIRTAVNIPIERLFWPFGQMITAEDQSRIFAAAGFSPRRPIIVYDGFSSFRAAALWTALNRANYSAALYFGAWPEWLIRAPDHLKIIPD